VRRQRLLGFGRLGGALTLAGAAAATLVVAAGARPTADTFKIGVIAPLNTVSANAPEFVAGAEAAAAALNKQGGIGGRQVEIVACSDGFAASPAADCARNMVAQDVQNVISTTSFSASSDPILATAKIPGIGSSLISPSDYRNPLVFPVVGGSIEEFVGATYFRLQDKGVRRVTAYAQLSPAAASVINAVHTLVRRMGREWVGSIGFPATTDVTPYVQQLKDTKADAAVLLGGAPAQIAFFKAKAALGLDMKVQATSLSVGEPEAAQFPDKGASLYTGAVLPPYTATNVPAVVRWIADLRAAGMADDPVNFKERSFISWLGVQAVKKLSLKVPKGQPVNKTTLVAAARRLKKVDLFGMVQWCPACKGPAAFPRASNPNVYAIKFVDGKPQLVSKQPVNAWKALGLLK
jgi:ABC-type branched-subunit amino acid transport system substrate-binding protein